MATAAAADDSDSESLSDKMKHAQLSERVVPATGTNLTKPGSESATSVSQTKLRPEKIEKSPSSVKEEHCSGHHDTDTSHRQTGETENVEVDLTDPEDLLAKLDGLDLTDEQYEALMEQAMSVNRQLKEQMRQLGLSSLSAENNSRYARSVVLPPIAGATRQASSCFPRRASTGSSKVRKSEKTKKS